MADSEHITGGGLCGGVRYESANGMCGFSIGWRTLAGYWYGEIRQVGG